MKSVLNQINGAFALAVLYADEDEKLLVARQASPLAIGMSDNMVCVASDALAMAHLTRNVIYLKDGDFASLNQGSIKIWDSSGQSVTEMLLQFRPLLHLLISRVTAISWKKKSMNSLMQLRIHYQLCAERLALRMNLLMFQI